MTYFINWSINWYHLAPIDYVVDSIHDYAVDCWMLLSVKFICIHNQQYNQHVNQCNNQYVNQFHYQKNQVLLDKWIDCNLIVTWLQNAKFVKSW